MADDKIYYPETITDQVLPQQQPTAPLSDTQTGANQIFTPRTIQNQDFPEPKVAVELIGLALNTRSRKILASFEFTKQGAIQIGEYSPGVSGDVRITPSGITARDQAGNTTFALDGDTGDAVFAGNLQSGTLVTGQVVMSSEGSIIIGDAVTGQTLIDAFGIVSTTNFPVSTLSEQSSQTFTNTTIADVASQGSISLTLLRAAKAIVFLSVNGSSEQVDNTLNCSGRTTYQVTSSVDGNISSLFYDSSLNVTTGGRENIISKPYTVLKGVTLSKGAHTIKLQSLIGSVTNFRSIMNSFSIAIILLGK